METAMTGVPAVGAAPQGVAAALPHSHNDVAYPPSEIPMSLRQWILTGAIVAAALLALPAVWPRVEPIPAAPAHRIPYALGNDYWLFEQFSRRSADEGKTLVIGDSVVWGHYVPPEGALSARLNARCGRGKYANLGVDGIHPAALEGLIEYYGSAVRGCDVVLHCNLLWMSSPRHDLQERKEFPINHPRLIPQFRPWIPCCRQTIAGRTEIAAGRLLPLAHWTDHLRQAYFGGEDLPAWTMQHPCESPFCSAARAGLLDFAAPADATEQTWRQRGTEISPQWVDLETSIQWASFRHAVGLLRDRGNRVFVVVGPLNEHMLQGPGLAGYRARVATVSDWLRSEGVPCCAPSVLSNDQYADASHPLAAGYDMLARELMADGAFAAFVENGSNR
jgi:hypothetical protein